MQDSGSLAVFKVTARDQGHYKGPFGGHLLHTVTFLVFFIVFFHLLFSMGNNFHDFLYVLGTMTAHSFQKVLLGEQILYFNPTALRTAKTP